MSIGNISIILCYFLSVMSSGFSVRVCVHAGHGERQERRTTHPFKTIYLA
jgi:hypothetical protein